MNLHGLGGIIALGVGASLDFGEPERRRPWERREVTHYETPKPLTKRQKRRMRGKARNA
jgi:hypothetical protein